MQGKWVWIILLTTGIVTGYSTTGVGQETERGAKLFHQYCSSCHGERGTGNGPVAPYLTVKPADLTRITERHGGEFPDEQITRIVAGEENPPGHGTRTMPVWGEQLQADLIGGASKSVIARGRIAFLVDYLKVIQGSDKKGFDNIVIPSTGPRPGSTPAR